MKKIRTFFSVLVSSVLLLSGCGESDGGENAEELGKKEGNITVLTAYADATPHSEILNFVADDLEKEGIRVDIVGDVSHDSWHDSVNSGEVDFHYNAFQPYLDEYNRNNDANLQGAGGIHIEPLVLMSEKYTTLEELPDNAVIAVRQDPSNMYRSLKLFENANIITLEEDTSPSNADLNKIVEFSKPIEFVAVDSDMIVPTRQDYDAYISNVSKLLEAEINPNQHLLKEDANDSEYANVICVNGDYVDDPSITKLVDVLQTEKVANFIKEKYDGAVEPAFEY